MPRPGEWIVGREQEKSYDTRFCKPIYFGETQPDGEDYSLVACASSEARGSLGQLRSDGSVAWSVPWPIKHSLERTVPRPGGGWYVSRTTEGTNHAQVAEIVWLSRTGDIERVLRFATMAWAQIDALEPTPDGGILAAGWFQSSLECEVDGKPRTLRSGYFGGFVAKIAPDLERVEWLSGVGGRQTSVTDVMALDDGGAAVIGTGLEEVTAGRLRAQIGTSMFWARFDQRGNPIGLHALSATPRAVSAPDRVFFASVAGDIGLIDPGTGHLTTRVPLPSGSTSTTESVVLRRSRWMSRLHGTGTWLVTPRDRAVYAPAYDLTRITSSGTIDRRTTVSAAPGSFFGSNTVFAMDHEDRLWMSGNVMSSTWDALPAAFAWWSDTSLNATTTIDIAGDRRIGAPLASGCESEGGAVQVLQRFASWRPYEWMEPCGLNPWQLHDLPATVTFDADGRVTTATIADPALNDEQRQCVIGVLQQRRVCAGAPAGITRIHVGP